MSPFIPSRNTTRANARHSLRGLDPGRSADMATLLCGWPKRYREFRLSIQPNQRLNRFERRGRLFCHERPGGSVEGRYWRGEAFTPSGGPFSLSSWGSADLPSLRQKRRRPASGPFSSGLPRWGHNRRRSSSWSRPPFPVADRLERGRERLTTGMIDQRSYECLNDA